MADIVQLSGPDLAAMLCSRVCHDLISPVGAIGNGLEVLSDPDQAEMADFAQELINNSAKQARAKLEFARLAFGASSTQGTEIDTRDAEKVALGYMDGEKADIEWNIDPVLLPKNKVKLLLNMVLLAAGAVPRGGNIVVSLDDAAPEDQGFKIRATGPKTFIPRGNVALLNGVPEDGRVDAQVIQPFYTGLLARESGLKIRLELVDEAVEFDAYAAK
ncbi:histidine phosphotransferase ChpT [Maritalea mediterranea]|uniref:Histidine phosphotransferase family protein n=1 Tax=Maritalea mediterranea TaxID=2909667 RepID=A0ABS9ECU7_9HYPH|nr:histidine phosphotransferase family protein [Maritalea mediterranea]MCF4099719.1 histidine phosphotransferase family protein [Maritalea mediterranea]